MKDPIIRGRATVMPAQQRFDNGESITVIDGWILPGGEFTRSEIRATWYATKMNELIHQMGGIKR